MAYRYEYSCKWPFHAQGTEVYMFRHVRLGPSPNWVHLKFERRWTPFKFKV